MCRKVTGAESGQGKGDAERNEDQCLTPEWKDKLGGSFQSRVMSIPFTEVATAMSTLRLQKRLTSSALCCGTKKVCLDFNETTEIASANSC